MNTSTTIFDLNNKKIDHKYIMPFCHFTGHNLWLLKPTKLNRGRGIHVCNNITILKNLIHKYCEGFKKKSITLADKSTIPPRSKPLSPARNT